MCKKRFNGSLRRGTSTDYCGNLGDFASIKVLTPYETDLKDLPFTSTERQQHVGRKSSLEGALIQLLQKSLPRLPKAGTLVQVHLLSTNMYFPLYGQLRSRIYKFKTVDHENRYDVRLRKKLLCVTNNLWALHRFYHPDWCKDSVWDCCGWNWRLRGCTPLYPRNLKTFKRVKSSRSTVGKCWLVPFLGSDEALEKYDSDLTSCISYLQNNCQGPQKEKHLEKYWEWYQILQEVNDSRTWKRYKRHLLSKLRGTQRWVQKALEEDNHGSENAVVKLEVRTWSPDYNGSRYISQQCLYKKRPRCEHRRNSSCHKKDKIYFRSQLRVQMRSNLSRISKQLKRRSLFAFEPFKIKPKRGLRHG